MNITVVYKNLTKQQEFPLFNLDLEGGQLYFSLGKENIAIRTKLLAC